VFTRAIARRPCENFARGLTTVVPSEPADYSLMVKQHQAYLEALTAAGLELTVLEPLPDFPDAHFVEDTAIVTPQVAVITNPGAPTRRGETQSIAPILAEFRKIERIKPPGTVDGGDVLQVENHFFIGLSERTNPAGAEQLGRILQNHGYTWTTVPVAAGLHFKSSVNYVGRNTLLVSSNFAGHTQLTGYDQIVLDRAETYAANTLLVNRHLLIPAGYPNTRRQLEVLGFEMIELEISEVRKMDGGLTCMSLRF
jgi:dimethylargininase